MKDNRRLAILFSIFLALTATFLALRQFNAVEEEKKEEAAEEATVHIIEMEEIRKISYQNSEYTIRLKKEEDLWVFQKEQEVELDQKAVTRLVDCIEELTAADVYETYDDLSDYGLDDPTYTVKLESEEETETILYVGSEIDGQYYLMTEGSEKVYTGGADLVTYLEYTPNEYVKNDEIPSFKSSQVKKIVVYPSGEKKKVYRAEKNEDEIAKILEGMSDLRFDTCIDYNVSGSELSDYGLNKKNRSSLAVYYENEAGETEKFLLFIGNADETDTYYYVRVGGSAIINRAWSDTVYQLFNYHKNKEK